MQALYIVLADWQASAASKADPILRLVNDDLKDIVIHLGAFFCSDKNENLGGAPAEFLPQMILEENPVRLFPAHHPTKTSTQFPALS